MSSATIEKKSFSEKFIHFCDKWTPNSMVVAYLLTAIVAILALVLTDTPFISFAKGQQSIVKAWTDGFWAFLELAIQVSLILITGSVIASSPPVRKFLRNLAMKPNNMGQAILLVMAVVPLFNWFHFGLGIMLGIHLGRMVLYAAKQKGYKIHTPLFVCLLYACGITGIGISQIGSIYGTIPGSLRRLVTDEAVRGKIPEVVSLGETAFLPINILCCVIVLFVVFGMAWIIRPKKDSEYLEASDALIAEIEAQSKLGQNQVKAVLPSEKIDNSLITSLVMGAFGLLCVARFMATGGRLDFNGFNFIMIIISVLLCGSPSQFIRSVQSAIGSTWGIIIQFPFYAGIFGLIAYTGLNVVLVNFFMAFATQRNFPFIAYVYTSIVNFAVPNGAAKFPIVAPYLIEVATRLNIPMGTIMNAYTCGDVSTNGFIPFWALPYLAMFKLDFKKILPYCAFASIGAYLVFSLFFLFVY
jgi:short-chain fatty acids transporter